jgi:membrane-associated phospholipid phosphatase
VQRRSHNLKKFLRARLSAKGFPGLYLTLALLVLIAAAWVSGAIAEDVATNNRITVVDARLSTWVQTHGTAPLTTIMLVITHLHSTVSVTIMTLVVCAYLWLRRLRYWVLTLLLSVFGGMLLNFLLKNLFLRPRPHFKSPLLTLTGYGFPSGHTMAATVFYGTLCVVVLSRAPARCWRAPAVVISTIMIALVGFSRIYLGAHYLSDVLAAVAEGLIWVALCIITVEAMRRLQDRNQSHAH